MAPLPASTARAFQQLAALPDVSEKGGRAPCADAHYLVIGDADRGEC
jgi:hypothetical protein